MEDVWILLGKAERAVPGPDMSAAAFELRSRYPGSAAYEFVIPSGTTLRSLAGDLLPRLRVHLEAKAGVDAAQMFVWLWFREQAHLFRANEIIEQLEAYLRPALGQP